MALVEQAEESAVATVASVAMATAVATLVEQSTTMASVSMATAMATLIEQPEETTLATVTSGAMAATLAAATQGRGFRSRAAHCHHQNDTVHATSRVRMTTQPPQVPRLEADRKSPPLSVHQGRRSTLTLPSRFERVCESGSGVPCERDSKPG